MKFVRSFLLVFLIGGYAIFAQGSFCATVNPTNPTAPIYSDNPSLNIDIWSIFPCYNCK